MGQNAFPSQSFAMGTVIVIIWVMSLCQSATTVLTRPSSHVEPVVRRCVSARIGFSVMACMSLVMMAAMKIPLSVTTATDQASPCAGTAVGV